jgi:DNA-directed RNA polymerase specialized sigma24 family protein
MADEAAGSITQCYRRLQQGDAEAAAGLWQRFLPRLRGLAKKTLAGRPQRVADADDAVQSAFVSFFQQVEQGQVGTDLNRDDLWNLLGVITVRKSQRQVRRETAAKRGGGKTVGEESLPLDQLIGQVPAEDFDLACEELLLGLDEELRAIAVRRLLGYRNREIAEELDCTERKIERKLNLIRLLWQEHITE